MENIKPILEQFVLGECFLCKEPCKPNAVLHFECAVVYSKEEHKRTRAYYKSKNM